MLHSLYPLIMSKDRRNLFLASALEAQIRRNCRCRAKFLQSPFSEEIRASRGQTKKSARRIKMNDVIIFDDIIFVLKILEHCRSVKKLNIRANRLQQIERFKGFKLCMTKSLINSKRLLQVTRVHLRISRRANAATLHRQNYLINAISCNGADSPDSDERKTLEKEPPMVDLLSAKRSTNKVPIKENLLFTYLKMANYRYPILPLTSSRPTKEKKRKIHENPQDHEPRKTGSHRVIDKTVCIGILFRRKLISLHLIFRTFNFVINFVIRKRSKPRKSERDLTNQGKGENQSNYSESNHTWGQTASRCWKKFQCYKKLGDFTTLRIYELLNDEGHVLSLKCVRQSPHRTRDFRPGNEPKHSNIHTHLILRLPTLLVATLLVLT
ncbi:hypothetical protein WN51_14524 [Melipona quadrifasciata]|uniref:Uncharacterized protein n=1 Tax=Melipona quadrifasciata TaxID=166423 RepID=A0A0N0U549_9HYME|nr:hypothetical protein WN51_14524 [Melipona quadrifasciata]